MTIYDLKAKLVDFQKAGDVLRLSVLRYLLAAVQNKEIELRAQKLLLDQDALEKVINKQIKQRLDSIELYKKGNRQDLVDKEEAELSVLKEFLS